MNTLDVSVWLIPSNKDLLIFQPLVNQLAHKYHSYPFIPHITLYHPQTSLHPDKVVSILQKHSRHFKTIKLKSLDVSYSNIFTQTLYIKYLLSKSLSQLFDIIKPEFSKHREYHLAPHLSLLYSHHITPTQQSLEAKASATPTHSSRQNHGHCQIRYHHRHWVRCTQMGNILWILS